MCLSYSLTPKFILSLREIQPLLLPWSSETAMRSSLRPHSSLTTHSIWWTWINSPRPCISSEQSPTPKSLSFLAAASGCQIMYHEKPGIFMFLRVSSLFCRPWIIKSSAAGSSCTDGSVVTHLPPDPHSAGSTLFFSIFFFSVLPCEFLRPNRNVFLGKSFNFPPETQ